MKDCEVVAKQLVEGIQFFRIYNHPEVDSVPCSVHILSTPGWLYFLMVVDVFELVIECFVFCDVFCWFIWKIEQWSKAYVVFFMLFASVDCDHQPTNS